MINRNKQLSVWLSMGLCRCAAIARILGVSRQYVDKVSKLAAGMSSDQWTEFQFAIDVVELDERDSLKHIEQNILRSAKLCSDSDRWIARNAKANLDKWVMILGNHKG